VEEFPQRVKEWFDRRQVVTVCVDRYVKVWFGIGLWDPTARIGFVDVPHVPIEERLEELAER
jgi:hypothetical protein